jgi:CheY-like chemotaxis protein
MRQTLLLLVVTDEEAVAELIRRVLADNGVDVVLFVARNGVEAAKHAQAQPFGLAVVDLDIQGAVAGQDICLKLRALRRSLRILPFGRALTATSFLDELGCAPLLLKQQVLAEPSLLAVHVQAAAQQEPVVRVPSGTLSNLEDRVNAALVEEQRREQPDVLVLCRHMFLRCGLTGTLTGLSFRVAADAADLDELLITASEVGSTGPIVGPLSDIAMIGAAGRALGRPALAIATQQRDLEGPAPAELGEVSLLLFDETGDLLQLLTALQRVAAGQRLVAVPPAVIARWVEPLDALPGRAWETLVTLLLTSSVEKTAQLTGVQASSVATTIKRVRRRLDLRSLSELLDVTRNQVTEQLGVLPEGLSSSRSVLV